MTFRIVFVERKGASGAEKAVGENVFLADLPTDPKVFAFFYPGDQDSSAVENRLRALGRKTGDNLLVNLGSLVDPDYKQAVKTFGIGSLPVIVITAVSPLAATPDGETAYVRLDGATLFAHPEDLVRTTEEIFNLFLGEQMRKAIMVGWAEQKKAALADLSRQVWALIRPVIEWAAKKHIEVGFCGVKIVVKENGAS